MTETLSDFSLGKKIQPKGMIQKVGVVGCGFVGQQIVKAISESSIDVVFIETTQEKVDKALCQLAATLDSMISSWGLTPGEKKAILSRIKGSTDFKDFADCDIVIETIHSSKRGTSLELRKEIFQQIEEVVSDSTIIASNTATLMISDIAIALKRPERAVGTHFITPLDKVNVIEVVKGLYTSHEALEQVEKFAKMIRRQVIAMNESPGNVSTRMMVTLVNEACEILSEGVTGIEEIDATMRQASGHQFGPFEMADRIGLDKVLKYMENLYQEFGDTKYKASAVIKRLVRNNYLGLKTSKGFYIYVEGKAVDQTIGFADIK